MSLPGTKGSELCENDDLYADLDMDEMDLNFENYEELFGMALNNSEELFENGGIDSLFGTTDMSGADSNSQGPVAAEVNLPHSILKFTPLFSFSVIDLFVSTFCCLCSISVSNSMLHYLEVHFYYCNRKIINVRLNLLPY